MADWREKAKERVKDKKAGATFKLLEGTNCFRILPSKEDITADGKLNPKGIEHPPFFEFRVHREVGPDKVFVRCGHDIEGGGKCWLCDVQIPKLEAITSKRDLAFEIGPRESFMVQVSRFDPDTKKYSLPKPWWVSNGRGIVGRPAKRPTLATQVQSAMLNTRKDFVDPLKGYNMYIERTGMGKLDTVYGTPEADEKPTKVPSAVLLAIKSFDELVNEYDIEDQKSAYYGKPKEEKKSKGDEDEDEDIDTAAEDDVEVEVEADDDEAETEEADDDEAVADDEAEAEVEDDEAEVEPEADDDEAEVEEEEEEPARPARAAAKKSAKSAPAKKMPPAKKKNR